MGLLRALRKRLFHNEQSQRPHQQQHDRKSDQRSSIPLRQKKLGGTGFLTSIDLTSEQRSHTVCAVGRQIGTLSYMTNPLQSPQPIEVALCGHHLRGLLSRRLDRSALKHMGQMLRKVVVDYEMDISCGRLTLNVTSASIPNLR